MLKKFFLVFLSLCIAVVSLLVPVKAEAVETSAKSAILINADTKEILYEKNSHAKLSMASTTKIMTAVVALENVPLNKEFTVTKEMVTVEGTSMGLRENDKVTMEALLYGLLLESGNDAANTIAYCVGGTIEHFAEMMNIKAKEIGLESTNFVTPSGLDDDEHYTTAYDMARLTAYALKNEEFVKICSSKTKRIEISGEKRTMTNHNRLLREYDGCIGVKTGFTKKSGRCLVAAAKRNNATLVAVTLNDGDDWNDMKKLFDYGFSLQKEEKICSEDERFKINVVSSPVNTVDVKPASDAFVSSSTDVSSKITRRVFLRKFEYAPIKEGDVLGKIVFYIDGEAFRCVPLIATSNAEPIKIENNDKKQEKKSLIEKIKEFFNHKKEK